MRFGLLQEGETAMHSTHYTRYQELVKEVQVAEENGYDYWGTSEQHFVSPLACVTSPEVLYAFVAAKTSRIKLRHMVTLLPFNFNHPIRVAERLATLDLLSDGRAELGMGRANHLHQLDAFQIDPNDTRPEMLEAMDVIDKALTLEEFEHEGPKLKIPKRSLCPRPFQHPRPPMFIIATSLESASIAGERGYGSILCDSWRGWDHLQEQVDTYQDTLSRAKPVVPGNVINTSMGCCALTGYCDETYEKAKEVAGPVAFGFFHKAVELLYVPLAKKAKDYEYMLKIHDELTEIRENQDVDGLIERTPTVLLGTPDQMIEKIKRLESMGMDEVVMRTDGMSHENILKSLGLMGKYVIPEFKRPNSVIRKYSIEARIA